LKDNTRFELIRFSKTITNKRIPLPCHLQAGFRGIPLLKAPEPKISALFALSYVILAAGTQLKGYDPEKWIDVPFLALRHACLACIKDKGHWL
jgi:hypothetical protein